MNYTTLVATAEVVNNKHSLGDGLEDGTSLEEMLLDLDIPVLTTKVEPQHDE